MIQIRNHTGQCCHPDCFKSVPEEKLFCQRHEAASKDAAEALLEAEKEIYGENWPPRQQPKYEASDS